MHLDTSMQTRDCAPLLLAGLPGKTVIPSAVSSAHVPSHQSHCCSLPPSPAWTRSVHLDAPGQRHGQQPVSGTADPGVVRQDKSSRGSADTTKTRSDPQRVRMSSGERPIGAAKGKQPDTEALCQTPPPVDQCPVVENWP